MGCRRGWAHGPSAAQAGSERSRLAAGSALTCDDGWWACQDLNLGPHPYQLNAGNRCADRPFPRSRPTVRAKVIGSPSAKLCVLFQTMRWSSLTQATILARDHKPGRLPTHLASTYTAVLPPRYLTSPSARLTTPTNPLHLPSLMTFPGLSNCQAGRLDHQAATALVLLDPGPMPCRRRAVPPNASVVATKAPSRCLAARLRGCFRLPVPKPGRDTGLGGPGDCAGDFPGLDVAGCQSCRAQPVALAAAHACNWFHWAPGLPAALQKCPQSVTIEQ